MGLDGLIKSIAITDIAWFQTGLKPLHALLTGAMGETIRHHLSGGTLLYITCSILKVENEQQMVNFFANHADAQEQKIEAEWGIEQIHGRQLLPQSGQGDGFYYCRIMKSA